MIPTRLRQPIALIASAAVCALLTATLTLFWPNIVTAHVQDEYILAEATSTAQASGAEASSTVSSATVDEVSVLTSAIPTSAPFTVTLTGADDPAQVNTFLRYLLAGYTLRGGYITATIGALPAELTLDLPLPDEAEVIGGYVRQGEFAETQLFVTSRGSLDELQTTLWQALMAQGFAAPDDGTQRGPDQVFLPQSPVLPDALCSTDQKYVVYRSTSAIVDALPIVRLGITATPALGGPCSPTPYNAGPAYDILPQLAPPAGALVQSSGGGGGGNSVTAEAEIQSTLGATGLAEHYAAQLDAAGWEQLDASTADTIAWSAWRFRDEQDNTWIATFYVVQLGDTPDKSLATLRADAQP